MWQFATKILNRLLRQLVISYISQKAFRHTHENVLGLVIFNWIICEARESNAKSSIDNIKFVWARKTIFSHEKQICLHSKCIISLHHSCIIIGTMHYIQYYWHKILITETNGSYNSEDVILIINLPVFFLIKYKACCSTVNISTSQ